MSLAENLPEVSAFAESFRGRDLGKWGLFAILGILTVSAIVTAEHFLIDPRDPEWKHIAPFRWILLPHAIGGAIALLAGPLQFSASLRRARPLLHRKIGIAYVAGAVVASLLGLYLGFTHEKWPLNYQQIAQAGGWLLCTVLAYAAARGRDFAVHRRWMARSYAFTFVFVASRLPWLPDFKSETEFATFMWFLVVGALFVPDLLLDMPALLRRRSSAARSSVSG
jgi:uncharacterized membrane protein